jgi:hypothetical protein
MIGHDARAGRGRSGTPQIVEELNPAGQIHRSVLAEDAIKASDRGLQEEAQVAAVRTAMSGHAVTQ